MTGGPKATRSRRILSCSDGPVEVGYVPVHSAPEVTDQPFVSISTVSRVHGKPNFRINFSPAEAAELIAALQYALGSGALGGPCSYCERAEPWSREASLLSPHSPVCPSHATFNRFSHTLVGGGGGGSAGPSSGGTGYSPASTSDVSDPRLRHLEPQVALERERPTRELLEASFAYWRKCGGCDATAKLDLREPTPYHCPSCGAPPERWLIGEILREEPTP